MEPEVTSALISAGTTLLVNGIIQFVIHTSKESNERKKERRNLIQAEMYTNTRDYLHFIKRTNELIKEIYIDYPKRKMRWALINPEIDFPREIEYLKLSQEERRIFDSLIRSGHHLSSLYLLLTTNLEIRDKLNIIKLEEKEEISGVIINPKIKKLGREFCNQVTRIEFSDQYKRIMRILDKKPNERDMRLSWHLDVLQSFNDLYDSVDIKYKKIEKKFFSLYEVK